MGGGEKLKLFDGLSNTCMDVISTTEPVSPLHMIWSLVPSDPNGIGYNVTVTYTDAFLNDTNNIQVFVFPRDEVGVPAKYYGKVCDKMTTQTLGGDLVSSEFVCPCAEDCVIRVKALAQGDVRNQGRVCEIDIK